MQIRYNNTFSPPAPVLQVAIAVPDEAPRANLIALIDTGADMTLVPLQIIKRLKIPVLYSAVVRSNPAASGLPVSIHQVDLIVNDVRFPVIEVYGDPTEKIIVLGRNFLNKMRIVLDGPSSTIEI